MSENEHLQKLFEGVVPERREEILSLVERYSAQFRRIGDKPGFHLDAGAFGVIQFTQRSLDQFWLFGFAGLYALHSYSGIAWLAKSHNLKFDLADIDGLPDQRAQNLRFATMLSYIDTLNTSSAECDFTWPEAVPNPENGKPTNLEQAVVFDLILMATAYIFLHELKHVIFEAEKNAPSDVVEEEMQCDAFAAGVMLDGVSKYAVSSGYSEQGVRMKRSMGIALGAAFLAVATPQCNLGGTASHPPVHKRWSATLTSIDLDENDFYWLYFASLAIAILKHRAIHFPSCHVMSFRQLALDAIEALEGGI